MDEINLIGLVGFPVEHSKSPEIYNHFFVNEGITSWEYQLFPFPQISEILNWVISNPNLKGFNVTIPHKQSIIPFLDEVDSKASEIGAVNTVVVQRNKNGIKLIGTNTDFDGFLFSVNSLKSIPKWAYVLGDGGSAKAVKAVLNSLDIPFQIVSRNPSENSITYSEFIDKTILPETLFVQTTPLGMWPNVSSMVPFPSNALPKNCFAIDLVYNPKETLFLKTLRTLGATCMNGETMLLEQAKRSWKYFKQNEI